MKTLPVKIGGKELHLAFTLDALANMEEMIRNFDFARVSEYARSPRGLGDLVYCMAQQGELLEGRQLTVSRAWIGAHLPPSPVKAASIQIAVLSALAEGLNMEADEEETGEVDEALEEIKKNGNT